MPNKKVNKVQITNASIELLRNGIPLSARNVAKLLNISTQPIYYLYKNMKDLENDLYLEAKKIYDNFVTKYFKNEEIPKYKAFGLAFVDFAKEEKGLFKHLYLDCFGGDENIFQNMVQDEAVTSLSRNYNISFEKAKQFHVNMGIFTFGLSMLQYYGDNLSSEQVSAVLTQEFNALVKIYKENK